MLVPWLQSLAWRPGLVTVSSAWLPSTFSHAVHSLSSYTPRSHPPHVSHLSVWVSLVLALSARLCFPVAFRLAAFACFRHLAPTGELSLPYGRLTQVAPPTPLGLPRSTRMRCHWGWAPPVPRGMGVLEASLWGQLPVLPTSPFQPVTVTRCHAASSEVHLRSPVQVFPSPVASFG